MRNLPILPPSLHPQFAELRHSLQKTVDACRKAGRARLPEDVRRARYGLERCLAAMLSGRYDIVVLDEVNVAIFFNLLTAREVLAVIDEKPASVELVLTGRYAPPSILRRADLVTEMRERKHYYQKNVPARRGIEK